MRRPGASPEVVGAMVASPLIDVHVRLSESKAIGAWVGAPDTPSDEELAAILGQNAARILRLPS